MALIACASCASNHWRTYIMKYYVQVTNVSARLCHVNSELDSTLIVYFGLQNEFLFVLWNMLWCAKCMFVCTMKYALVCKMNVCLYYEICFGMLSWTCWNYCPGTITCLNHLNCDWKWALVLTLLNTIAQKCYPCISTLFYNSSLSPLLLLASPRYH